MVLFLASAEEAWALCDGFIAGVTQGSDQCQWMQLLIAP